ncbi:MAG: hypothetical protein CSA62_01745 [Planctomycetota bacterium]|nr:MAG: hypothetical protein CSA62_01745 [Planctomycetota bacterium]
MEAVGESFWWNQAEPLLDGLAARGYPAPEQLIYDQRRGVFADAEDRVLLRPPAVLSPSEPGLDAETWLEDLPSRLGLHLLVLLRAGAFAAGLWEDAELIQHKCQKRYVSRGRGLAQSTYLAKRGTSRYGSRLRLQNAARLLEELRQRLDDWIREQSQVQGRGVECLLLGAPVRMRARLFEAPIPTAKGLPIHTLGQDFAEPCFEELGRQYRLCCQGELRING